MLFILLTNLAFAFHVGDWGSIPGWDKYKSNINQIKRGGDSSTAKCECHRSWELTIKKVGSCHGRFICGMLKNPQCSLAKYRVYTNGCLLSI